MRLARMTTTAEPGRTVAAVGHGDAWIPLERLGVAEDTVSSDARSRIAGALEATAADQLDSWSVNGSEVDLRQPLSTVGKIICIGLNYKDHIAEIGATAPAVPLVFAKYANALNAPYGGVRVPGEESAQLDYESELAVIVGRAGTWIAERDALSYVSGYAVANDVSTRDVQFAEGQWTRSKSFDGFCPLGPWITTSDVVADPGSLEIGTQVNGEKRQESSTSQLLYGIEEIISFVSRGITLEPGDVILTGTPPGVAMGSPEPQWLVPGDVVQCWVEGLGEVRNEILPPV